MEKKYHLRPAKAGDEAVLCDLIREMAAYEKHDLTKLSVSIENLKKFGFQNNPFFSVELAEFGGVVVAHALYFYTFSSNLCKPILYLEELYVRPAYRREGIGTGLLKKLAQYALEKGCCRLEWHVFDWNTTAINFYHGIGAHFKQDLRQVRLTDEALQEFAT